MDSYLDWARITYPQLLSDRGEEYMRGLVNEAYQNVMVLLTIVLAVIAVAAFYALNSVVLALGIVERGFHDNNVVMLIFLFVCIIAGLGLRGPLIRRSIAKRASAA